MDEDEEKPKKRTKPKASLLEEAEDCGICFLLRLHALYLPGACDLKSPLKLNMFIRWNYLNCFARFPDLHMDPYRRATCIITELSNYTVSCTCNVKHPRRYGSLAVLPCATK